MNNTLVSLFQNAATCIRDQTPSGFIIGLFKHTHPGPEGQKHLATRTITGKGKADEDPLPNISSVI